MTNKYCQALAELRSKPAHELKEVGDQWRTPDLLFWGINAIFGPLVLDLFADDDNAKCPVWYTAEDNALVQDWAEMLESIGGAAFGKCRCGSSARAGEERGYHPDAWCFAGNSHQLSGKRC